MSVERNQTTSDGQCPQCGYALSGLRSADCPECGRKDVRHAAAVGAFPHRKWLHRFAMLLVATTFGLIMLGGTVTSKGVGLAVPDWPTTYGDNMFLFPPSLWKGGIFWEHTHRLLGSVVGMMCIAMMIWLWVTQRQRPWLRWTGVALLAAVITQGIMGGLRVTELSTSLAVLHGITAQLFLCLTVLIAAATGRHWPALRQKAVEQIAFPRASLMRGMTVLLLATLVLQLALGAAMRHNDAGLAIPDFPTSYGSLVPPFDDAALVTAMDQVVPYDEHHGYYTGPQVAVHFAHRAGAVVVSIVLIATLVVIAKRLADESAIRRPMLALLALLIAQAALGASVIWTGRHPEVATAHQATGAILLATAALLAMRIHVRCRPSSAVPRAARIAPDARPNTVLRGAEA